MSAPLPHEEVEDINWARKMSDHVAYGLLVYTGLVIFVTIGALRAAHKGTSLLPYWGLIILVAAFVMVCRYFEKAWKNRTIESGQADDVARAFRSDCRKFWLIASGAPIGLAGLFWTLNAVA